MQHPLLGGNDYDVHVLIPQNNESGELEINNIGDHFQDNNEFILHNGLINERGNLITDIIQNF